MVPHLRPKAAVVPLDNRGGDVGRQRTQEAGELVRSAALAGAAVLCAPRKAQSRRALLGPLTSRIENAATVGPSFQCRGLPAAFSGGECFMQIGPPLPGLGAGPI